MRVGSIGQPALVGSTSQRRAPTTLLAFAAMACGPSAPSLDATTSGPAADSSGSSSSSGGVLETGGSTTDEPQQVVYSALLFADALDSNLQGRVNRFDPGLGYCARIVMATESASPMPTPFPDVVANETWRVTRIFVNATATSCLENSEGPDQTVADAIDADGTIEWQPHPDCRVTASVTVSLPGSDLWPQEVPFDVTDLVPETIEGQLPCEGAG